MFTFSLSKKQEQKTHRHFFFRNHIIFMFTAYSDITAVTTESSEGYALPLFAGHHSLFLILCFHNLMEQDYFTVKAENMNIFYSM